MKQLTKTVAKKVSKNLPSSATELNTLSKTYSIKLKQCNKNTFETRLKELTDILNTKLTPTETPKKKEPTKRKQTDASKISKGLKGLLKTVGGCRDFMLSNTDENLTLTLPNEDFTGFNKVTLNKVDYTFLVATRGKGKVATANYKWFSKIVQRHHKSGMTGTYYILNSLKKHRSTIADMLITQDRMNPEDVKQATK